MIKDLEELVGLRLESVRVSRGSYELEFDGFLHGQHASLLVSTPHYLANAPSSELDAESSTTELVWPLLESSVVAVRVSNTDSRGEVVFQFPEGSLVFWAPRPSEGELVTVANRLGPEWSVFL